MDVGEGEGLPALVVDVEAADGGGRIVVVPQPHGVPRAGDVAVADDYCSIGGLVPLRLCRRSGTAPELWRGAVFRALLGMTRRLPEAGPAREFGAVAVA